MSHPGKRKKLAPRKCTWSHLIGRVKIMVQKIGYEGGGYLPHTQLSFLFYPCDTHWVSQKKGDIIRHVYTC
jgi:hypothetical protein